MNKDLLERIAQIQAELKTQHNDCTANPVFQVKRLVYDCCIDEGYADDYIWCYCDGGKVNCPQTLAALEKAWKEDAEFIKINHDEDGEFDTRKIEGNYIRTGCRERWEEYGTYFLTRKAAQDFMEKQMHRIKNSYTIEVAIFTESLHRNNEMICVVEFLKNIDLEKLKNKI